MYTFSVDENIQNNRLATKNNRLATKNKRILTETATKNNGCRI
ncbi:MAG: hypothetical protein ACX93I_10895 [Winogradskyella sp.]